jgi:hypothetical protein
MPQASPHHAQTGSAPSDRQAFHRPHTSMGATTGHWVKTAGILSPLLIGELVKDPEKKWRYIRLASVATTLVSEALWSHRIHKERQQRDEQRER